MYKVGRSWKRRELTRGMFVKARSIGGFRGSQIMGLGVSSRRLEGLRGKSER